MKLKCPVCRANFRESFDCLRCGADLKPLMDLVAQAWLCRRTARQALNKYSFEKAMEYCVFSRKLYDTSEGQEMQAFLEWINSEVLSCDDLTGII